MDIKLLFKALKFACLPTLSVLVLLICGFFSITKAIAWISSDHWFAVTVRVLLVIAEITLVLYMYNEYDKEANFERERIKKLNIQNGVVAAATSSDLYALTSSRYSYRDEFRNVFRNSTSDDVYKSYDTPDSNIKIIERIAKKI